MNLYQEIYHGESFQEEDFYDAARYAFHQELAEASPEEIDKYLIERVNGMTAEEAEGFWSSLGNVAKKVGSGVLKVASVAAPIAGTAIGAVYGMPQLGGMAGGVVGNLAGAGAGALDKVPDFKSRRKRRKRRRSRPSRGRRRGNAQLRNTLKHSKRVLGGVGRAALRGANRYAKNHPVKATNRPTGPILGKNSAAALSSIMNNPQFQALLFGRANASQGEYYSEDITENDFDYLDMVEAVNYLTEDIITEYYEEDLLDDDTYSVDEEGELVLNYPEDRMDRVESFIEELV